MHRRSPEQDVTRFLGFYHAEGAAAGVWVLINVLLVFVDHTYR
jgi:hypothetical protein